jgi:translation initiation factor 2B subunit (eIF-2B alpha/beta/delta family)
MRKPFVIVTGQFKISPTTLSEVDGRDYQSPAVLEPTDGTLLGTLGKDVEMGPAGYYDYIGPELITMLITEEYVSHHFPWFLMRFVTNGR